MEMLIARLVILGSCLLLTVVPLYFIFHHVYKDGAFGRLGLSSISMSTAWIFVETVFGGSDREVLQWLIAFFFFGVAVFILWHLCRWHRRVLRNGRAPLVEELTASPPAQKAALLTKVHG